LGNIVALPPVSLPDEIVSASRRLCPNSARPVVCVTNGAGEVIRVFCPDIDPQTGVCRKRSTLSSSDGRLVDCDLTSL
jgi:hypothetical protein